MAAESDHTRGHGFPNRLSMRLAAPAVAEAAGLAFVAHTSHTCFSELTSIGVYIVERRGALSEVIRGLQEGDILSPLPSYGAAVGRGSSGETVGSPDRSKLELLEQSVARALRRRFSPALRQLARERTAVLRSIAYVDAAQVDSVPVCPPPLLADIQTEMWRLVSMWRRRYGRNCLAAEREQRAPRAAAAAALRVLADSEKEVCEQVAPPRRRRRGLQQLHDVTSPSTVSLDMDTAIRAASSLGRDVADVAAVPGRALPINTDFEGLEHMWKEGALRVELNRLGRGGHVAQVEVLPAFRALSEDDTGGADDVEEVAAIGDTIESAASDDGASSNSDIIQELREDSTGHFDDDIAGEAAGSDVEPAAAGGGLLNALVQGVRLQQNAGHRDNEKGGDAPRSAAWLERARESQSTGATGATEDVSATVHDTEALGVDDRDSNSLPPLALDAAAELGLMARPEALRELLAARTEDGWRSFVGHATDSRQRLARVQLVLAALNVHPEPYVEGSAWFMGPFFQGPGRKSDLGLAETLE